MPASRVFKRNIASGAVSFNVIPLVDCVFLMILFFILTSQISNASIAASVKLAMPKNGTGQEYKVPHKIIINVLSAMDAKVHDASMENKASGYSVNGQPVALGDTNALTALFRRGMAETKAAGDMDNTDPKAPVPNYFVVIRADRRVRSGDVIPIVQAAAGADVPKMNISVLKGKS